MFIERRHALVTKAPEGRHVMKRKVGKRGGGEGRKGSEEAGKREGEGGRRRGWVSQPIGRGNPAPTIGIVFRSSGALCL